MVINKLTVDEHRTRKEDDMKTLTFMIPSVMLCVGLMLTGCAANGTVSGEPFADKALEQSVDSHKATVQQHQNMFVTRRSVISNSHKAAVQQHQNKVAMLEQKIQKLEDRLDMIKNSYRDPKGLKRQSWTRLLSQWRGDVRDLREHIVWHEKQIALLEK
ncbi:MAG: hypothetical protein OXF47_01550 [Nitrospira sp.]|nr:hypothetical protein [Nitrospira sp.]